MNILSQNLNLIIHDRKLVIYGQHLTYLHLVILLVNLFFCFYMKTQSTIFLKKIKPNGYMFIYIIMALLVKYTEAVIFYTIFCACFINTVSLLTLDPAAQMASITAPTTIISVNFLVLCLLSSIFLRIFLIVQSFAVC